VFKEMSLGLITEWEMAFCCYFGFCFVFLTKYSRVCISKMLLHIEAQIQKEETSTKDALGYSRVMAVEMNVKKY
jgi:hypothetical protein